MASINHHRLLYFNFYVRCFACDLSLQNYISTSLILTFCWPVNFCLWLESVIQVNSFIHHLIPCHMCCSSASTEMIPFLTILKCLVAWLCYSASHCFITAQLIYSFVIILARNFSLWWAYQGKATVWPENSYHIINERNASLHIYLTLWTEILLSCNLVTWHKRAEQKSKQQWWAWLTELIVCLLDCAEQNAANHLVLMIWP